MQYAIPDVDSLSYNLTDTISVLNGDSIDLKNRRLCLLMQFQHQSLIEIIDKYKRQKLKKYS